MSTSDSMSWGRDAFARGDLEYPRGDGVRPPATGSSARSGSLLFARMAALIVDGFVLVIPLVAVTWMLAQLFPHHGFFFTKSGTIISSTGRTTSNYKLGLPGLSVMTVLALDYFFICEALHGRTVGKRSMGLSVQSTAGGPAGVHRVAARNLLRPIDALPFFYLLGALTALISGRRRRRIGDLVGGTVVVHEEPPPQGSRASGAGVLLYPLGLTVVVMLTLFATSAGASLSSSERAIAVVRSYIQAREQGNAALACSMLTVEQQRELVALQSRSYRDASATQCPAYILQVEPNSHLLNPVLAQLLSAPLVGEATRVGPVVVRSLNPPLELVTVSEDGLLKLDVRGLQRAGYLHGCSATGRMSISECTCVWTLLRMQGMLPEGSLTSPIVDAMTQDDKHCLDGATTQA